MRFACLYALADGCSIVKPEHLVAALALWDYSAASTAAIFGDMSGDATADRISAALTEAGEMSETDIRDLFGRHKSSEIDLALSALARAGKAKPETVATSGRPKTVWRYTGGDKSDQSDQRAN